MYDKKYPQRKKLRLQGYDYSQNGAYFITICVVDKHEMLGSAVGAISNRPRAETIVGAISPRAETIVGAITNRPQAETCMQIELSEHGIIVDEAINEISNHYTHITVDKYVIMPNHVHMILLINNYDCDGRLIIAPTYLSTVIKELKRCVSKRLGFSLWQKSFHDRVIRDEEEYYRIWKYIDENPLNWESDEYHAI